MLKEIETLKPRQEFMSRPELNGLTLADKEKMTDWLRVGQEGYDQMTVDFLLRGMAEFMENLNKGIPFSSAMIAAKLFNLQGNTGNPEERRVIFTNLKQKLGENADEILGEGFSEVEGQWQFNADKKVISIGEEVEALVDEWYATESPQAKLTAAERRVRELGGEKAELERRVKELQKEVKERKPAREPGVWGEIERQEAKEWAEALPAGENQSGDLVKQVIELAAAIGKPTEAGVTEEQIETLDTELLSLFEPQLWHDLMLNVLNIHAFARDGEKRTLVSKRHKRIREIVDERLKDYRVNNEKVSGELVNSLISLFETVAQKTVESGSDAAERLAQLPNILRWNLEQQRAQQAMERKKNEKIQAVRTFFEGHEIALEPVAEGGQSGVEAELRIELARLRELEMNLGEGVKVECATGNEQVNSVEFELDSSGNPVEAKLTVAVFTQYRPDQQNTFIDSLSLPYKASLWGDSDWKMASDGGKIQLNADEKGEVKIEIKDDQVVLQFSEGMILDQAMEAMTALISALDKELGGQGFGGFALRAKEPEPEPELEPEPEPAALAEEPVKSQLGTGNL
ncbi:MAG: hypothetical protein U0946_03445 [Patescibacteria group bacterium]|nr:hypothetical protein [Patescibacteria group bacterium]